MINQNPSYLTRKNIKPKEATKSLPQKTSKGKNHRWDDMHGLAQDNFDLFAYRKLYDRNEEKLDMLYDEEEQERDRYDRQEAELNVYKKINSKPSEKTKLRRELELTW